MTDKNEAEDKKEVEEEKIDLEAEVVEEEGDDVEALKKKIGTLQHQKKHFKNKFEEATKPTEEKPAEKTEEKKETEKSDDLTMTDVYALTNAKIPEEDVDAIKEVAKLKGITVAEALKTDLGETILEKSKEKRTVADATNTGKTGNTGKGASDEELLSNAKNGEMPESDEDMERLVELRVKKK